MTDSVDPASVTDQINSSSGEKLYRFMRTLERRIKSGDKNPMLKTWFHQGCERAIQLNRDRFGDWEDAKRKLSYVSEPHVGNEKIGMCLDDVNGYPCQYIRESTGDGVKRLLCLVNGRRNCMFILKLGEVTAKEVNKLFNG